MDKKARQFPQERLVVICIVPGLTKSKVTGAVIKTHQTIYLAANGSAKEENQ